MTHRKNYNDNIQLGSQNTAPASKTHTSVSSEKPLLSPIEGHTFELEIPAPEHGTEEHRINGYHPPLPLKKKSINTTVEIERETFLPKPTEHEDDFWDDEEVDENPNILAKVVIAIQNVVKKILLFLAKATKGYLVTVVFLVAYAVYFILAMRYSFEDEGAHRLLGFTILGIIIITREFVSKGLKLLYHKILGETADTPACQNRIETIRFFTRWLLYGALAGIVLWAVIDSGWKDIKNLRSLPGLFVFCLIGLLLSSSPSKINWHTIYWSLGLQFLFALIALRLEFGKNCFLWLQSRLDEFFSNSKASSILLFGESYEDHYMVFGAFPLMFFTNSAMALLYYLGAMQFIIKIVGKFLEFVLETSPVESMSVAAGMFMEGIAAVAALRPYLRTLSKSQLFLVLTSCLASLGGAYLAVLSSMGIPIQFLISAMLVSAPATFAICKLMVPETSKTEQHTNEEMERIGNEEKKKYSSALDAIQTGAIDMLAVIGNVIVAAFAFFSFIGWTNSTLTWIGDRVGIEGLTIELIASYVLYPIAMAMGIEPEDCRRVGMLLGYRIGASNIIAFLQMMQLKRNRMFYNEYMIATNFTGSVTYDNDDIILDLMDGQVLKNGFISERSEAITSYSLCGFSSFLSVAIHLGMMCTLVPNRKDFLLSKSIMALIAGNLANCMTACFASIFY